MTWKLDICDGIDGQNHVNHYIYHQKNSAGIKNHWLGPTGNSPFCLWSGLAVGMGGIASVSAPTFLVHFYQVFYFPSFFIFLILFSSTLLCLFIFAFLILCFFLFSFVFLLCILYCFQFLLLIMFQTLIYFQLHSFCFHFVLNKISLICPSVNRSHNDLQPMIHNCNAFCTRRMWELSLHFHHNHTHLKNKKVL